MRIIPILICACWFAVSSEASTYRIDRSSEILAISSMYGIHADATWEPEEIKRESIEKAILLQLNKEKGAKEEDIRFIRTHIKRYTIEYGGIIRNEHKTVFCLLHLIEEMDPNWTNKGHFTLLNDGGSGVLFIEYDPSEEKLLSIGWHGEA